MTNTALELDISSLRDTARLGAALAESLAAPPPIPLFLRGALGAGKTTLIRFLAGALPGGQEAEISSPSFTLCNVYPTVPETRHFDLYRLEAGQAPEELMEALEAPPWKRPLVLAEWPDRLPPELLPPDCLHCRLTWEKNHRRAFLEADGKAAAVRLALLRAAMLRQSEG
ncbi:MAG: tRNA (adenosine(37)-N6)-threonylcarbamoyltransferase complex ATPase subunit type 1 TsaE [Deltaproteobacteria bacterium]|jgi:tRNA threonylcarbamoyladenosine biosynthesis protein TsaE|nr:tRNA (adenosine(37)-N6)-threonylcarbamoyltransferase complex ATPase subunit type 1 TsaE [Deltaproteobacteria bacterium]